MEGRLFMEIVVDQRMFWAMSSGSIGMIGDRLTAGYILVAPDAVTVRIL